MHSNGGFYVTNDVIHRSGIVTAFMTTSATFDAEQFKKLENEIDERKTEYETKTSDAITKLKENLKTAQNLRVTIAQIKKSASNMQIFLCLKELECFCF
jgi:hypothetical protein